MKTTHLLSVGDAADRVYEVLRDGRESVTTVTASGERYRAFRDGRGVTLHVGRAVVYLASPNDAAAYLRKVATCDGTADQRASLADLIARTVAL